MRCRFDNSGYCHNVEANRRDGTNVPSVERCSSCSFYSGRARGLGDAIHSALHAVGIAQAVEAASKAVGKDCGCADRRAALNAVVPFDDDSGKAAP
jgi:hypothetical protein